MKNSIKAVESHEVEIFHFDIVNGHFNPNLQLAIDNYCESRQSSILIGDVHPTIENLEKLLDDLIAIGVDRIAFSWEVFGHTQHLMIEIKNANIGCGTGLNPIMRRPDLKYLLQELDFFPFCKPNLQSLMVTIFHPQSNLNLYHLSQREFGWVIYGGFNDRNNCSILARCRDIVVIIKYLFSDLQRKRIVMLNQAVVGIKY